MSPELRFVAQLNRLSRAIDQAALRAHELELLDEAVEGELQEAASSVERTARWLLECLAERGSRKSAG